MEELKPTDVITVRLTVSEWNFIRRMREKPWWHKAR